MTTPRRMITALVCVLAACATTQARPPGDVVRANGDALPRKLYGDWSRASCRNTLILSHGLGGSEEGLDYAAEAAVGAGYRVLVMGHKETGPRALFRVSRASDRTAEIRSDDFWIGRERDLEAALDFATADCRPSRLVLGGHSMGAALAMIEAGAESPVSFDGADRFDAYIAISPQGIGWAFETARAWAGVDKPVLMVTGTEDDGFDGTWRDRIVAFENLPAGNKRLVIIDGASHFNLGGRRNEGAQSRAADAITAFLEQMQTGWTASALSMTPGVEIREK